jgi:hypothetical protein
LGSFSLAAFASEMHNVWIWILYGGEAGCLLYEDIWKRARVEKHMAARKCLDWQSF